MDMGSPRKVIPKGVAIPSAVAGVVSTTDQSPPHGFQPQTEGEAHSIVSEIRCLALKSSSTMY
jgi:hypothetical protein